MEFEGSDLASVLVGTPTSATRWATSLVDVRRGQLVDVIEGRSAGVLRRWLATRPRPWTRQVEVVSIDPFEAYRAGISPHLPHALVVADPFHIVRVRREALCVRRRVRDPPC